MPEIGRTILHYEIAEKLGSGGMGEVYRAKDLKLGREVALKVLPEEFAEDADRAARFQREAKVLASLNHPNIATIYGLEESKGTFLLILELVEGNILSGHLEGAPKNIDAILKIALQIAEALEAAHEKGILHRDLKPANIKVTPEGRVKVLDFGLAKAFASDQSDLNLSNSPTLSLAATQQGMILGTAGYMSPEQARGWIVDKRCDIWSFGVLLFEMLTGKRLFESETISDTLAAVLRAEADWNALPADLPSNIRILLRRCLTKDSKQRLRDIGEARIAIEEYLADPAGATASDRMPASGRRGFREGIAWCFAGIGILGALILAVIYFRATPAEAPELRLEINTPATTDPSSFAVSPDGRRLAFVASAGGQQKLWQRALDQTTAQPLEGTEDATSPFWSPDARSIGFCADLKLKRIEVAGGPPQVLANAPDCRGGTWNRDGVIVFAPSQIGALFRIPAGGGEPVAVTRLDPPRQQGHAYPQFLPDGRHVLFFAEGNEGGIYLASVDSTDGKRVMASESAAAYTPPGYLLFLRQGSLVAQHFDAARGQVAGDPVAVANSAIPRSNLQEAGFSVSETGLLAYRASSNLRKLVWFDRSGEEVGTLGQPDESDLQYPQLSPDVRRVAVARYVGDNRDIWLIDTARGVQSRFTIDTGYDGHPIWSPDGSKIVFGSNRKGPGDLYDKASTGIDSEKLLLESSLTKVPCDWSKDGRFILYLQVDPKTAADLWALPLFGDGKPFPIANTGFEEALGQFSPDGRWVAYMSNESGSYEVYVKSFPGPGGKWQVSVGGGIYPRWRQDGKELFYIDPEGKLMAVAIQATGQMIQAGTPVALFRTHIVGGGSFFRGGQEYAVAPDGQRFLININANESNTSPIIIVTNWARALKKQV